MKKIALTLALLLSPVTVQAKPYLDIQELKTSKGITVWYVQDKMIPVIALKFSIKGVAQFDPPGKDGVGNLLTTLFDEGAGKRDAEAFQDTLDSHGISMGFDIGRDAFYGSMKTTVKYNDLAVELLDDALNRPHIKSDAFARMQQAVLSSLRFQETEPNWIAQKTLQETLFAGNAYARLSEGTADSVSKLTVDDVKQQKEKLFCRDHLIIAAAGDIDPKILATTLDRIFGQWPACSEKYNNSLFTLQNPSQEIHIPWAGAQSSVIMAQLGLKRQDKDWWAARILDFALGGGEFSSRLMDEVRVKRGLTYGVFTSIVPYERGPLWMIQAGIDPAKTTEAISVIKNIWSDVAREGLRDDEIKQAKDYLIGSLPLALTSTDKIAAILLQLQEDDLSKQTLDNRAAEINAVTSDDIKRVAKTYLQQDKLTTIIVGPKQDKKQ